MDEKILFNDNSSNIEVINEKNIMEKEAFLKRFTQLVSEALMEWEQSKTAKGYDG